MKSLNRQVHKPFQAILATLPMRHTLFVLSLAVVAGGVLIPAADAEVVINPDAIEAKVREYIAETTPMDEKDATLVVSILNLPSRPVALDGNSVEWMISDSRATPLTFRAIIQVTMSTEAETRKIGVPVQLAIEKPVWVVKKIIRAKEPISRADVVMQRKQLDHNAPYAVSVNDDLNDYSTRINLKPGNILDVRQLSRIPAVYHNEPVRMIMDMPNGVEITLIGTSLEDAPIGKRIRIKQTLSDHKVQIRTGIVVAKNTVKVGM